MTERMWIPEEMDQETLARFTLSMIHRLIVHHGLWFAEVERQMGMERALDILNKMSGESYEILMKRFSQDLGFEMAGGIPKPLLDMSKKSLIGFLDDVAKNWLANDGLWFQAVEFDTSMFDAKRCNDSCWVRYSPLEVWSIRQFTGLPEQAGLEGLKKALNLRMYSRLNKQTIIDEGDAGVVFQMNECRVQTTRKRKGLEDYPCKSVGVVEYREFARAIDKRIRTECIGCPPDDHPDQWYCAWRFTIEK